jgi:DnaJ-class molecular chaperone
MPKSKKHNKEYKRQNPEVNNNDTTNYYEILGLERDCTSNEIDTAYRKLALKWHPDKNINNKTEAEKKFRDIVKAYQVLSNPDARKNYDSYGVTTETDNLIDPFEIFKEVLNDNKVPDVIIKLEATLDKLYKGFTETVNFTRFSPCSKCEETGTRDKKKADCEKCKGSGLLVETVKGGKMGYMLSEKKCDVCSGKGLNPNKKLCKKCNGNKYLKEDIECDIDVPPGAYDQYFIKVENEGNYIPLNERDKKSNDVERSNVIVVIKEIPMSTTNSNINISRGMFIQEINRFDRADLLIRVDVEFGESIMGIKKEIAFLNEEKISIDINNVILNGDIYVVKNMGMPLVPEEVKKLKESNSNKDNKIYRGDLFIMFKIKRPQLKNRQRKRLWQVITDTPYPIYDVIENIHNTIDFKDYVDEQKKFNTSKKENNKVSDNVSDSDSDNNTDDETENKTNDKQVNESDNESNNKSDKKSNDNSDNDKDEDEESNNNSDKDNQSNNNSDKDNQSNNNSDNDNDNDNGEDDESNNNSDNSNNDKNEDEESNNKSDNETNEDATDNEDKIDETSDEKPKTDSDTGSESEDTDENFEDLLNEPKKSNNKQKSKVSKTNN